MGASGRKFATWRPQQRYRVAAKKLLRALDNQVRVGMGKSGLKFFQKPAKGTGGGVWSEKNWETWPFLFCACDLGSDNVSGLMALINHFLCNVELWGDLGHACNRDTMNALGAAALKQFWQVMMCVWNTPHGPNADEQNYEALQAVVNHLRTTYSHGNLPPLFLAAAPRILEVLRLAGIELPGEQDPEYEAWDWMLENWNASRGAKVTACRFQGTVFLRLTL